MSERYGECSQCWGRGELSRQTAPGEVLGDDAETLYREGHIYVVEECSRCGGTGFSGGIYGD